MHAAGLEVIERPGATGRDEEAAVEETVRLAAEGKRANHR